ncbi:MAG: phosphate/phosphite/phosphonate ABC transporter substrate-binding protein [Actinomycetota bacterium]|nr:phosphate/phosphite/phosphonate ABC transporter substrate-binding protein [Actinomycetota bacterium]
MKKLLIIFAVVALLAHGRPALCAQGKLIIGVIPEYGIEQEVNRYAPLARYLGQKLGIRVGIKFLPNYGALYEELRDGALDAGFMGAFDYCMAHSHAKIEALARQIRPATGGKCTAFTFVRNNSRINSPASMKGRTIALVDPLSTTGYLAQRIYFKKFGIDIDNDVKIFWAGTHQAAITAVLSGQADMGAAKDSVFETTAYKNTSVTRELRVMNTAPGFPDNVLAINGNIDKTTAGRLKAALLGMSADPGAGGVLRGMGASGFTAASDRDYSALYSMIKKAGINLSTYSYAKISD